jgi:hypothetical protein
MQEQILVLFGELIHNPEQIFNRSCSDFFFDSAHMNTPAKLTPGFAPFLC